MVPIKGHLAFLCVAAFAIHVPNSRAATERNQPNIVLLVADDPGQETENLLEPAIWASSIYLQVARNCSNGSIWVGTRWGNPILTPTTRKG